MTKLTCKDILIRQIDRNDWPAILPLVHEIAADGTSYVFDESFSDDDLAAYWLKSEAALFGAYQGNELMGFYKLIANQPGRGSHVGNASYVVSSSFRGRGLGEILARDSFEKARAMGFEALQFNIVVSTNRPAVNLWRKMGFVIVGTVPRAFAHPQQGLVDIHIMHRYL